LIFEGRLIAENIAYGFEHPRDVLIDLAIDDGVTNRGHRENIFNSHFQAIGTCKGEHKGLNVMAVVIYAGDIGSGDRYDDKIAALLEAGEPLPG